VQEAIRFIEHEANAEQPFMLYWTPDATHTPLYASEKFRGRSSRGLCVAYLFVSLSNTFTVN